MSSCNRISQIVVTRGTTNTIAITIKKSGELYKLLDGETLRFGVKKNIDDSGYLIRRDVLATDFDERDKCYYITIFPKDTEGLALGTYKFDIGIQPDEINYYNIFPPSQFILTTNITRREN